jgi:hypothetical protein
LLRDCYCGFHRLLLAPDEGKPKREGLVAKALYEFAEKRAAVRSKALAMFRALCFCEAIFGRLCRYCVCEARVR